ncbi:tetratricopeptide repeat-containing glycosyltransferase family protein [Paraburkholderia sediminicola]|uniref:Tetratricopeptide repeat-containing glycosyltransferase family protein n=1 Tax=Paraburkholderia rhynchosiae TaxID=487049 RepID=A0ACC7N656_9BURK
MCAGLHTGLEVDAYADANASASALLRLAAILDTQCRHADAATLLRAAQIAVPPLPGVQARLALSLSAAGEHAAAREQFEIVRRGDASANAASVDKSPVESRLHLAFSRTLLALDAPEEALAQAERAVADNADDACAHAARGDALAALLRLADALSAYQRAAMLQPSLAWAHYGIGTMFIELGRPMAALQGLSYALELSERMQLDTGAVAQACTPPAPLSFPCLPVHASSTSAICESIGLAWAKGCQLAQALPWFERALELEPNRATALRHMGNALAMMRADDAALACLQAARRVRPDWDKAWLDEAGLLLRRGDYAEGWRAYGKREGQRLLESLPSCWSGEEPLADKTILLVAEQGLGDTIQFARYAPQVAALAQRVILEVQLPLRPLFDEVGRDWGVEIVARGDARPDGDHQCLLLSLPRILRTTPDATPEPGGYLRAPVARRALWRERLAARSATGRLRVGLAPAGNPQFKNDALRSIPLAAFEACFDLPGVDWVIPQPEIRDADRAVLERHAGVISFGAQLDDFADTAALLEELDLVISVDTSIAHLAGALARPVWILLPHFPDWRWMHDRADTPWYPSARLFRQTVAHDWDGVIKRVRDELSLRVARFA